MAELPPLCDLGKTYTSPSLRVNSENDGNQVSGVKKEAFSGETRNLKLETGCGGLTVSAGIQ